MTSARSNTLTLFFIALGAFFIPSAASSDEPNAKVSLFHRRLTKFSIPKPDTPVPQTRRSLQSNACPCTTISVSGLAQGALNGQYELAGATEITSAISNKQLRPVMRTQYMRTAFQIPYDATVRVSLDSNLCMLVDRTKATADGEMWYRDPNSPVPLNEITRFPHASGGC